ncbi:hypothetical protein BTJ40_13410 [Microbulbifer sp. A4B17]|nr:hypothetical protein BTJ40_13410 [Microbulbifer sp. A4B17]
MLQGWREALEISSRGYIFLVWSLRRGETLKNYIRGLNSLALDESRKESYLDISNLPISFAHRVVVRSGSKGLWGAKLGLST